MKKKILFIIVFLVILIVGITGYFFYNSKKLSIKVKEKVTINLYDTIYNTAGIEKIKNGTIQTKKKPLDTSKVKEEEIHLSIKDYFGKIHKISYKIEVVDKEAPVITFNANLKVEEKGNIDLLAGVSATDNSKEEIEVIVKGEYDLNTPGVYELYYVAKDSSGNEAREKFQLEVTKKVVVQTTSGEYRLADRTFTTSNGHQGVTKNGITYIDGIMIANKTYPLPSTYNPGDLTSETVEAFTKMKNAASNDGISLFVASGFRSYSYQNGLYNRYVSQDGKTEADTYSARPGHSEHQTGLAFDLNKIDRNFGNTPEGKWLNQNASKYGFILRYPEGKTNETGYIYEPWHFRYVGRDLAEKLYNGGDWITLETYFGITSEYSY